MTKPADPTPDLNDIIASAVAGRVEAQVLAALTDSETFNTMVIAALQQQVEVPDGTSYGKKRISYMNHTLQTAIRSRTKELIAEEIEALSEPIRAEVRKGLRKSVGVIADSLVDGFVANASGRFPSIKVEFSSE
jgi:hypothetical protein